MTGIVVIPAFNEAANLPRVIPTLRKVLSDAELLFIDDGSSDDTARVLQEHGVNWLRHPVNLGYKETIVTGMRWARKSSCSATTAHSPRRAGVSGGTNALMPLASARSRSVSVSGSWKRSR